MRLHVVFIHLNIILLCFSFVASKILSENNSEELTEDASADISALHQTARNFKQNNKFINNRRRGRRSLKKPYAIMFRNEEPVGILQGLEHGYELLPIHSDESVLVELNPLNAKDSVVIKREARNEDQIVEYADKEYPYIFAKFQVDSRVAKDKGHTMEKRAPKASSNSLSETHKNSLKSTLSNIEKKDETAKAELQGILNDMGLTNEAKLKKRAAEAEDEDLEHGTNKINLITSNKNSRDRREEKRYDDVAEQMEKQIKERLQKIKEEVKNEIDRLKTNTDEDIDNPAEEVGYANKQRKKRQTVNNLMQEETNDLNPVLVEDSNLVPHIRRRRKINQETPTTTVSGSATIEDHFKFRLLQSIDDDDDENEETLEENIDEEVALAKSKKSCPCSGKDCTCGKKKTFRGDHGLNMMYFDGAPRIIERKFNLKQSLPLKLQDGEYSIDLNPSAYKFTEINQNRRKRNNFMDLVKINGGEPVINHLVAVRERSMLPKLRIKRTADSQLTLENMPQQDLFGELSESFDGELARFKRVKRDM